MEISEFHARAEVDMSHLNVFRNSDFQAVSNKLTHVLEDFLHEDNVFIADDAMTRMLAEHASSDTARVRHDDSAPKHQGPRRPPERSTPKQERDGEDSKANADDQHHEEQDDDEGGVFESVLADVAVDGELSSHDRLVFEKFAKMLEEAPNVSIRKIVKEEERPADDQARIDERQPVESDEHKSEDHSRKVDDATEGK